MKKILSSILILFTTTLSMTIVCFAAVYDVLPIEGDLTYTIRKEASVNEPGEVSVKAKDKNISGNIEIPTTVTNEQKTYHVTSIEDAAFISCSGLTSISIPNSVKTIGYNVFDSCPKLISINVDKNNTIYKSVDGILYSSDYKKLIKCPEGKTGTFYIQDGVVSIGNAAFYDCSGLTGSLTIPNGVTSIGHRAFYGCSGLTGSLTIPSDVTTICYETFYGCSSLKSVTIPSTVTSIGYSAFCGCSSLESVNFLGDVNQPGSGLFSNCPNLATVNYWGTTSPIVESEGFMFDKDSNVQVNVPCNYIDNYFNAEIEVQKEPHSIIPITEKASTCTENGNKQHWWCSKCGTLFSDKKGENEILSKREITSFADGHNLNHVDAKDATCTREGNIEHYLCSKCNKLFKDEDGTTEISDLTIPALGHNYETQEVLTSTETALGGTHYVCSRCEDEKWADFTKDDKYAQTLMPNGETIYHYCTKNDLAAETTVDVGDGQTLKVFLQDPLGVLKKNDTDVLGIVVTYVPEGSARYNELMNQVDGDHPIEHIKFFNVYPTVNGVPVTGALDGSIYMEYEIPDGWDEEDLEMILVQKDDDQEFDETVLDIDGKRYLATWKNHFSPYAMIDKLSEEEQAALNVDKLNDEQKAQLNKAEEKSSENQVKTGDEAGYIVLMSSVLFIIAGLYLGLCMKKKAI
ncbi:MAG TPA: hypothetical protein DCW90_18880 [Lachnospiraceae bacterium]|nr:hypothetical protein [Lachnospiraceae bacterium]